MSDEAEVRLRLSAQIALLGAVTPNLRSFSVELKAGVVRTLAVFETEPSEAEDDLIQVATTEIIAAFWNEGLDDRIVVSAEVPPPRLALVVYERYEPWTSS